MGDAAYKVKCDCGRMIVVTSSEEEVCPCKGGTAYVMEWWKPEKQEQAMKEREFNPGDYFTTYAVFDTDGGGMGKKHQQKGIFTDKELARRVGGTYCVIDETQYIVDREKFLVPIRGQGSGMSVHQAKELDTFTREYSEALSALTDKQKKILGING